MLRLTYEIFCIAPGELEDERPIPTYILRAD